MIPENMQKPAAIWDWDGFGNSLELSVDANMQNMMGKKYRHHCALGQTGVI